MSTTITDPLALAADEALPSKGRKRSASRSRPLRSPVRSGGRLHLPEHGIRLPLTSTIAPSSQTPAPTPSASAKAHAQADLAVCVAFDLAVAKIGLDLELLAAAGGSQIAVVAGARDANYLSGDLV
jgi:hypothetical protein